MNSLLIYSSKDSPACRDMIEMYGTSFLESIAGDSIDICSAQTLQRLKDGSIEHFPTIQKIPALVVIEDGKVNVLIEDSFQNYVDKKLKSVKFSPNTLVHPISPRRHDEESRT